MPQAPPRSIPPPAKTQPTTTVPRSAAKAPPTSAATESAPKAPPASAAAGKAPAATTKATPDKQQLVPSKALAPTGAGSTALRTQSGNSLGSLEHYARGWNDTGLGEVTSAAPSQGQGQSQRTVTTPGDLFIKMHAAKQALTEADKTTEVSFLSSLPILPLEKPSVEYSVDKPRVAYSVDKPSVAYTIPSPRDSGGVV